MRTDDKAAQVQPLSGIRVLELGTMIAGPVAATLLADFGAEVIKIEAPGLGDPIRKSGPMVGSESLYWNVEGRSKQSITLDLRRPEGQQVLRDLVRHADVLIENFRPGTMAGWNIGYEALKEINPRLIMLSISGFGQTGPYASRPAYDRIALAFAGFLNMTGYPDRPPVRPGTSMADYQAALFGAFAVMIALFQREARGGTGQQIDVSLYETIFRFTDVMVTAYDKLGLKRERTGNAHFAAAPGDHYETADGSFIAMTVAADTIFKRLCDAIGRNELASHPDFATHRKRVENYTEINNLVAYWFRSRPASECCDALEKHAVPHSRIYTAEDILADPHYAARESIATLEHPVIGPIKMPNVLPLFSGCKAAPIRPAPALGADTSAVLSSLLGMSKDEIAHLQETGTI
ncbi:CaiB/BaiF CoA transferase family protein [Noviherbaspirillum sedimenti]|uniref:CoA transferase n=1 Tax=Noviherbaspirillum sedimenti TaxID=2320865 RepID=A0A3A3GR94_9BURK|nr:CoA transferase [Noviherbaspirillum sedimenti]RJG03480.1 CoA transferase [Noviherbaspirillum sedimenti]